MILDDLVLGEIAQVASIVVGVGYDATEGAVFFEASDDGGATTKTLRSGNTRAQVAPSDEAQPAIEVLGTGEIVVSVTYAANVRSYLSRDFGEHWTAVDAVT